MPEEPSTATPTYPVSSTSPILSSCRGVCSFLSFAAAAAVDDGWHSLLSQSIATPEAIIAKEQRVPRSSLPFTFTLTMYTYGRLVSCEDSVSNQRKLLAASAAGSRIKLEVGSRFSTL